MSVQPFYNPKFHEFDTNGDPLSGGLLYTYAAGTTTPLATYTTRAGDVANSNPVVLDANGEADVWVPSGVDYKYVLKTSAGVTRWTVDNVPPSSGAGTSTSVAASEPGGRLTLTSGTPVTTSDVTGATTVYYVPYKSDQVPLYDGSTWALTSIGSSGVSQATTDATKSPAAAAANKNYDMFVWNDSGVVRLSRGPAWSSDTARGTGVGTTELEQVNGRHVNKVSITNGPAAQRGLYVGTIRSDGSSQANDSIAKRHVWNMHNRTTRAMRVLEATVGWAYSTDTWRQARATATNQLSVVIGLNESSIQVRVQSTASHSDASGANMFAGIGLDSTSAVASGCVVSGAASWADGERNLTAFWSGFPGLGYHYLAWLERSTIPFAAGTTTFLGATGAIQSGIHGEVMA